MEEGSLLQHLPADISHLRPGQIGPFGSATQRGPGTAPDCGTGQAVSKPSATSTVTLEDSQLRGDQHKSGGARLWLVGSAPQK